MSLYDRYRWSKTIFRILRHHSFTGQRPKLIQENHKISPTLLLNYIIITITCTVMNYQCRVRQRLSSSFAWQITLNVSMCQQFQFISFCQRHAWHLSTNKKACKGTKKVMFWPLSVYDIYERRMHMYSFEWIMNDESDVFLFYKLKYHIAN